MQQSAASDGLFEALRSLESRIALLDGRIKKAGPKMGDMMMPGFHSADRNTWHSLQPLIAERKTMEKEQSELLTKLAEAITESIDKQKNAVPDMRPQFMLTEPLSLTVIKKSNSGFAKRPHVGGEEFRPLACYAGKRGKLIYVFKPVAAADYAEMEMEETLAKRALSGFDGWLKTLLDSDMVRAKNEAMKEASMAAELEKFDRAEYADFGSW